MMSRKNVGILGTLAYPKILVTQKKKLSVPLSLLDSFGPALTIFRNVLLSFYGLLYLFFSKRPSLCYGWPALPFLYIHRPTMIWPAFPLFFYIQTYFYTIYQYIYEYLGAGASYRSIETGGSTISFTDHLSHVILMFR